MRADGVLVRHRRRDGHAERKMIRCPDVTMYHRRRGGDRSPYEDPVQRRTSSGRYVATQSTSKACRLYSLDERGGRTTHVQVTRQYQGRFGRLGCSGLKYFCICSRRSDSGPRLSRCTLSRSKESLPCINCETSATLPPTRRWNTDQSGRYQRGAQNTDWRANLMSRDGPIGTFARTACPW